VNSLTRTIISPLAVILAILFLTLAIFFYDFKSQTYSLDHPDEAVISVLKNYRQISFFVLGDSGTGRDAPRQIALQMEQRCGQRKPEGILLLGDVVYPDGVESVEDPQWQEKIFSVFHGECLKDIPIYPVLGNHDYNGNTQSWVEKSKLHDRWNFPSRNYTVKFPGHLTIYAIDSVYPIKLRKSGLEIPKTPDTPWAIAIGHHPITSQSTHGAERQGRGIRPWLLKRQLCNKVNAYFSGHSHHLEYDFIPECNMDHYVSGGGGAGIYKTHADGSAPFVQSAHGFLELVVSKDELDATFISIEGETLFNHRRSK